MRLPFRHRKPQEGSAVLVLLALLSIAALLAVSNQMILRRLSGELRLVETRQLKRLTQQPVQPLEPAATNRTNVVSVSNGATGTFVAPR